MKASKKYKWRTVTLRDIVRILATNKGNLGKQAICFKIPVATYRLSLNPLGYQRAGCNGRSTAKCFKPGISYLPLLIHLNLWRNRNFRKTNQTELYSTAQMNANDLSTGRTDTTNPLVVSWHRHKRAHRPSQSQHSLHSCQGILHSWDFHSDQPPLKWDDQTHQEGTHHQKQNTNLQPSVQSGAKGQIPTETLRKWLGYWFTLAQKQSLR